MNTIRTYLIRMTDSFHNLAWEAKTGGDVEGRCVKPLLANADYRNVYSLCY